MTKKSDIDIPAMLRGKPVEEVNLPEMSVSKAKVEETSGSRDRPKRKKIYERVRNAFIPKELKDHFAKQDYDLRWIRWAINGVEDYSYLQTREDEGYEFVQPEELPEWYRGRVRMTDTRSRRGLVTDKDLCLMKIDSELRQSRRDFFSKETDMDVASVDVHVLERKGFRNLGTRSKVVMREPTFSD